MTTTPEVIERKKPTMEERAVRGVLGGWLRGNVDIELDYEENGDVYGHVIVFVPAAAYQLDKYDKARLKRRAKKRRKK